MSLARPIAVTRDGNKGARSHGTDPFVIVAGLIVAILFGSLLLWLNGHEEINGMEQPYGNTASVAAE